MTEKPEKKPSRTSIGQLRWMGKKLLKLFIAVVSIWVLMHGYSLLTDHRLIKVEQYYPDENGLQQTLYTLHPIGTPLADFVSTMEKSKLIYGGDPVSEHGPIPPYVLKSPSARHVSVYYNSWGEFCVVSPIKYASVYVEYDQDKKITGIFVSMTKRNCEFGL